MCIEDGRTVCGLPRRVRQSKNYIWVIFLYLLRKLKFINLVWFCVVGSSHTGKWNKYFCICVIVDEKSFHCMPIKQCISQFLFHKIVHNLKLDVLGLSSVHSACSTLLSSYLIPPAANASLLISPLPPSHWNKLIYKTSYLDLKLSTPEDLSRLRCNFICKGRI